MAMTGGYQPKGDVDWRTLKPPRGGSGVQRPPPVVVRVEVVKGEPPSCDDDGPRVDGGE